MIDDDDDAAANCLGLGRTLEIINSLIHSSYPTRCFPAKWQSIRDKLDQLSSVLAAAGVSSNSSSSSALAELVEAISATAGEAQLLAQRCSDESYHGGKLQLRSDVDVIASKLELHIKHLLEINTSGVLNNSRAIILSRPRPSASREDMRLYVRDLLSRMKIGDLEMRARALAALNDILGDGGDKYVSIVAAETADGISLLLCLLESRETDRSSSNIQEDVAAAISLISGFDGHRGALVAAGAIAQLVRVLETGSSPTAKMSAIRAMKNLTENSENAWSVSAHGGVTTLLKLCGGDAGSNTELIGLACDILRNLSGVKEIKKFMVEEGVVTVLVRLSRSKHELSQIRAVEFLIALLASEDATIKQVVVREGTVDSLVQILDPNSSSCSTKARELALRAIEGLCSDSTSSNSVNILLGSGILDRLLFFLSSGEISVQESALKAAFRFCSASPEANKAMGEVGFMPELVNLLEEARSFEVREMAAGVLCSMVSVQRNRRRFIGEGQGINQIMHLLDPAGEEKSVNKMSLLSVLMLLTDSSSGRRKVAASSYVKNLEKLAETDVTDAKKIVKKLSGNRFRSVINDIWRSYH